MVVLKQFQKNLFHMLHSLARILWDTGVPLGGKGCFFLHYKFSNWSAKSSKALIELQECFLLLPIEKYISLATFAHSKDKILNITTHM